MTVAFWSCRADLAVRSFELLHKPRLQAATAAKSLQRTALQHSPPFRRSVRCRSTASPESAYEPRVTRWGRYEDPSELITKSNIRNPLNYFERERRRVRLNQYHRRRMVFAGLGLGACIALQVVLVFTWGDEQAPQDERQTGSVEHLDARSPREGEPGFPSGAKGGVRIVGQKPGVPGIALDEEGNELVETGNSTIPYFPRTIRLPIGAASDEPTTSPALPAAAAATTQAGRQDEEYTLLGHGIRTVTLFSIQVYYLGVYVRTSDLPELQRRFVTQAAGNASATSLIPPEKAKLREGLLDGQGSQEIWDAVLRQQGIRSAVRVVPVKNTDFAHLRDGWVRGITTQTQDAARRAMQEKREGPGEYDDEQFGQTVQDFKGLFSGRGKAPTGSVMMLAKDEKGGLTISYQNAPTKEEKEKGVPAARQDLGRIPDERVARLIWLVYLSGKNPSSEPARKSVVDGVMELVERPMGTVGIGVA